MSEASKFLLGEFHRTVDERFRVSIPRELAEPMTVPGIDCVLAKERPGALSLWSQGDWQVRLAGDLQVVEDKYRMHRLDDRLSDLQSLGRLLSTRHKPVQLVGRGRLSIPEGFREFLGVDPNGPVVVVGAALCIELWRPSAWLNYLEEQIPQFRSLLDRLAT